MEKQLSTGELAQRRGEFAVQAPLSEQLFYALEAGDEETAYEINELVKALELEDANQPSEPEAK